MCYFSPENVDTWIISQKVEMNHGRRLINKDLLTPAQAI